MNYADVLDRLAEWGEQTDSVRAVLLTGSAAAGDAHPLSDRDFEIYTRDVASLLNDESWWEILGEVLVVERLENDRGHPTRLVYYVGGKLDFTLIPAEDLPAAAHARPFHVIVDKDGRAPNTTAVVSRPRPPEQDEFDEAVNWGYAAALMCAKAIVREELWSAKLRDHDLKAELLRMIEWDHQVRYGTSIDTHYLGTRMNAWMDADVRSELHDCWGHFDSLDTARALHRTTALFTRLARRVAAALEMSTYAHDAVHTEMESILRARPDLN